MDKYRYYIVAVIVVSVLGLVIACNGGSGTSTNTGSIVPVPEDMRIVTGTLTEADTATIAETIKEASYKLSDINKLKAVDEFNNTYITYVDNGEFSIPLPAGRSYIMEFLSGNNFVASLAHDNRHWFKLHEDKSSGLALGHIRVNIVQGIAEPTNDPWEGHPKSDASPFEDTNGDNIPDIFLKPYGITDPPDDGGITTPEEATIPELVIDTGTLPDGAKDVIYNATLSAAGGVSPYTWSVSVGILPDGLTIDPADGIIEGTPTAYGIQNLTIKVMDSRDVSTSQDFSIKISGLAVTTSFLPNATNGTAYATTLIADGHPSIFTWSKTAGSLPTGITLNTSTGEISGTPTVIESQTFSISVFNGVESAIRELTITVNPANTWTATSTSGNCPSVRYFNAIIYTGETGTPVSSNKVIVWGGTDGVTLNTGGIYDPNNNTWTKTSTSGNCPAGRGNDIFGYTWTGNTGNSATSNKMIVWGGADNAGGIYDPATDTWTATSTSGNCPTARNTLSTVWTGDTGNSVTSNKMIIWGGTLTNTGAIYDPATDTWTATSTSGNCPTARNYHTAVWTGDKMIVWGGTNGTETNTGGVYDPVTNTWSATSTSGNCPTARYNHTAIWTGDKMIVWGSATGAGANTGGIYDPTTDTWEATSTSGNCPSIRYCHTAVWTGSTMIIWGGANPVMDTGGIYDPASDTWTATATGPNVPNGGYRSSGVWTGSNMIIWGGWGTTYKNTGGIYTP